MEEKSLPENVLHLEVEEEDPRKSV